MPFNHEFFEALLRAPGPSSFESKPARVWQDHAENAGLTTTRDTYGNTFATANPDGGPRLLLSGHIDEIGLLVTHVDEQGFAWFKGIGGWDPQQLVGQPVRIVHGSDETLGVIGRKPIHLMTPEDRKRVARMEDMWIDVGAANQEEALEVIAPGDIAVLERAPILLKNHRISSKAIDNRIGAYVALEAAKRSVGLDTEVIASATVQEEIGGVGSAAASFGLNPDVAIAIDVTHATDVPDVPTRQEGHHPLGSGPELSVGSYVHRGVFEALKTTADEEGIAFTVGTSPRRTATDADFLAKTKAGVATAVVSIPNRYMHSGNETIDTRDVEQAVRLIVAFAGRLKNLTPFTQI